MTAAACTMPPMPRRKPPPADGDDPKKPSRKGKALMCWIDSDIADALDRFIKAQRVEPKIRPVVEVALQEFLQREGFYPPPKPPRP